MSHTQELANDTAIQFQRFRWISGVGVAAALLWSGMAIATGLLIVAILSLLIAILVSASFLWARNNRQRTETGMRISLYGSTLAFAIMSFGELPDAATVPFFMALVVLVGSLALGTRDAVILTVVASIGVVTSYLAYWWAALLGVVPSSGFAIGANADLLELAMMALRRVLFLFAVLGVAAAARRALDRQLQVVHERGKIIAEQSAELIAGHQHFSALAENIPVGILETDAQGAAIYNNQAWSELVSATGTDVLGESWRSSIHDQDLDQVLGLMRSSPDALCADPDTPHPECVVRIRRPDGALRWVRIRVAPLLAEDGTITGHILAAADETTQRAASEQLQYLASHDHLTAALNRSAFELKVGSAIARARRYSARCALLFLDIDNLKLVNDNWGHAVGDRVISEVASRIQADIRKIDAVGRLGGDEFGILMDQVGTQEDATNKIDYIQNLFNKPIAIDDENSIQLRVSIGSAVYPDEGLTFDDLSRTADNAMYAMKGRHSARSR